MSQINVDTIATAAGTEQARLVQVVNTQTGALATGTTVLPIDDTIPQNTEGDQYMSLAITPTHASNILIIESTAYFSAATNNNNAIALFQDSTAGALAAGCHQLWTATAASVLHLRHKMVAGTTSSTTFKIRVGNGGAGTTCFNGVSSARIYGGSLASNITISEIRA